MITYLRGVLCTVIGKLAASVLESSVPSEYPRILLDLDKLTGLPSALCSVKLHTTLINA